MMSTPPRSAADPRPGGRPYYIAATCPRCGTALVLLDSIEHPAAPEAEIWFDEWTCPCCRGGIWLDWPAGELEDRPAEAEAAEEHGDGVSLETLHHELGL